MTSRPAGYSKLPLSGGEVLTTAKSGPSNTWSDTQSDVRTFLHSWRDQGRRSPFDTFVSDLDIMLVVRTGYARVVTPARPPYCSRCDQTFNSDRAKGQHNEDSTRHNTCVVCQFDGSSRDQLVQHHRSTGHRIICNGCGDGGRFWIPGSQAYKDHLRNKNVCTTCEGHFNSLSNLQHVSITVFKYSVLTLLQSFF